MPDVNASPPYKARTKAKKNNPLKCSLAVI